MYQIIREIRMSISLQKHISNHHQVLINILFFWFFIQSFTLEHFYCFLSLLTTLAVPSYDLSHILICCSTIVLFHDFKGIFISYFKVLQTLHQANMAKFNLLIFLWGILSKVRRSLLVDDWLSRYFLIQKDIENSIREFIFYEFLSDFIKFG